MTVVWTSLIKSGWFEELEIVDSEGRTFAVASAKKRNGVGFMWGFNPFYGRRVRVGLELHRLKPDLSLDKIKNNLLALLKSWSGWKSRDDYNVLVATVHDADSIGYLIKHLSRLRV